MDGVVNYIMLVAQVLFLFYCYKFFSIKHQ